MKNKICSRCKQEKPLEEFPLNEKGKNGLHVWCKDCFKRRSKSWYANNKDKAKEYYLKRTYSISLLDLKSLLSEQNGLCKICKDKISFEKYNSSDQACLDHCHETGKIRGLLCNHCNRALGLFRDDPKILERAIKYLVEE